MFVCQACLRKGLAPGALARINAPAVGSRLALPRLGALTPNQSTTTLRSYHLPSLKPKAAIDPSVTLDLEVPEGEEDGEGSAKKGKKRDLSEELRKKLERNAYLQLKHFKDPFHIEKQVKLALDKGKYDEALILTRKASKDAKVQVSWNHLIDYHMKNKRLSAAIKIYNEMKKRAQVPDARTYTIIFRGCAMSEHPKQAVAEAIKIYHSLLRNERVKPTTIHLNAVLETCARAGDLDSMFTTVQTANESTRKPDNLTYTIIFNALRAQFNPRLPIDRDPMQRDEEDIKREKQEAISRALQIWEDVQRQWRKGNLRIDEEMACSLGRLLTLGTKEDNERVFDLLATTMQLPRFHSGEKAPIEVSAKAVETTATPAVSSEAPSSEVSETTPTETASEPVTATGEQISEIKEAQEVKKEVKETKPKFEKKSASITIRPDLFATPGNNTLSLILSVLSNTRRTSLAQKYWDLLTSAPYSIKPDRDNYFRYLRVLQIGRGSAATASAITAMPAEFLTPMMLKTAFTTCIRDELNPHAFSPNACTIFDAMTRKTRYPDAIAMRLFLQSAQGNFRHIKKMAETDPLGSRQAMGKQIILALDKMWQTYRIMVNQYSYPIGSRVSAKSPEDAWKAIRAHMSECVVTARRMISALDKVMLNNMCSDEAVLKVLKQRRVVLQNMVKRYVAKDDDLMKKWREKMIGKYGAENFTKREADGAEDYEFGQPKPNEFEKNLNKKDETAAAAKEKAEKEQRRRREEEEEEDEGDEDEWEDVRQQRLAGGGGGGGRRDKTNYLREKLRRDEKNDRRKPQRYDNTSNNRNSSWSREKQGDSWGGSKGRGQRKSAW